VGARWGGGGAGRGRRGGGGRGGGGGWQARARQRPPTGLPGRSVGRPPVPRSRQDPSGRFDHLHGVASASAL